MHKYGYLILTTTEFTFKPSYPPVHMLKRFTKLVHVLFDCVLRHWRLSTYKRVQITPIILYFVLFGIEYIF